MKQQYIVYHVNQKLVIKMLALKVKMTVMLNHLVVYKNVYIIQNVCYKYKYIKDEYTTVVNNEIKCMDNSFSIEVCRNRKCENKTTIESNNNYEDHLGDNI